MSEPVEALLFDLGGVFVDIDFQRAIARWAAHAGCEPERIRGRYMHDEAYERHERNEIGVGDYFASLRTSLGIDLTDAQFLDGWNAIFGDVIPGFAPLLARAAAQLPTYAFTNTNPAHEAFWSVRFADGLKPFRRIFVSSTLGLRKPERRAFDHVAREIGVPAARILFFDDAIANVEGARAAGMQAVHVRSNEDVVAALEPLLAKR
ncbi:MAG TPA: HAD family phosphatase [Rhizomicrobium sp.]|jgi:FMN phosphatase YigB (HAD superfamily)|nr:HAD family phosphatase [Rhizomicrobium sp.]